MTETGSRGPGGDQARRESRRTRRQSTGAFFRDLLIVFLAAVLVSLGIKAFLVRSFYIPSGSMENTLQEDDRIIVNELEPRLIPISRGDVVVFEDPGGWLDEPQTPPRTGLPGAVAWSLEAVGLRASAADDHLIKRVIGLPGDTVRCCTESGEIEVDGIPLDEPYLKAPNGDPVTTTEFEETVPTGSYWVMGDNRGNSWDSRFHLDTPSRGFVPVENVVGRAVVITWPYSHWAFLDSYPQTFRGTDDDAQ
jgi:signal peptidase I